MCSVHIHNDHTIPRLGYDVHAMQLCDRIPHRWYILLVEIFAWLGQTGRLHQSR